MKTFTVGQRVIVDGHAPAVVQRYFSRACLYQVRFEEPQVRKPDGVAFTSCLVSAGQMAPEQVEVVT